MLPRKGYRTQLNLSIAFGMAVLLLAGGLSFMAARGFGRAAERRREQSLLLDHTRVLLSSLQDAETGQRGFLLTGQESYLAPYVSGSAAAGRALADLAPFAALPMHRPRMQAIDSLVQVRLASLSGTISVRRTHGLDSALALVGEGSGKATMDSLRAVIAGLQQEASAELEERDTTTHRLSRWMLLTIPLGCALAILFLLLSGRRVHRELAAREAAEAALQVAARETEDLYDHAPCGYHSLDSTGRYIRVNLTEAEWLGCSREELIGRPFAELLTPASQEVMRERFPRFLLEGSVADLQFELVRRDGTLLPVALSATAVRDPEGRFLMSRSTVHDVTERRRAAEALQFANEHLEEQVRLRTAELAAANQDLRESLEELRVAEEELRQQNDDLFQSEESLRVSEGRLRTALLKLPLILFQQDRDLRYTWIVNPHPAYTVEAVTGRTDRDLLQDEPEVARFIAVKRQVLESGVGHRGEFVLTIEGNPVTFDCQLEPLADAMGRIVGVTGACIDVTAIRQEQDARRQTLDRLEALVSASPQALIEHDLDGRVLAWYGGAERMFGWSGAEAVGQPVAIVPPELMAEYDWLLGQALAGVTISDHETLRRRKDGSTIAVTIAAAPLHDSADRVTGLVTVCADITERRRREEEQRGRELAEAANRSKSQFLANMSHELRTPLNAIIGFSELLEDRSFGDLNERQGRYVGNILTSGRHLLDLINDILDLAKIEAGKLTLDPVRFDPIGAIREVQRIVEPLAMSKRIALTIENPAGTPDLTADRAKFKQILYNLLSNAIKFTPEDGQIRVEVRELPADSSSGDEGPRLSVSVRDTGVGIDPRDHLRVFNEFEQVDSSYARQQPGTGLGLALTRRLVELHGGRISLRSALGEGSTFTVLLPLGHALPAEAGTRPPLLPTDDDSRPLVLVVEDDPVSAELLRQYLTQNGYAVAHAWNAAQAVDVAQRLKPAAITLDILLPDEDGLEVLSRLRTLGETRGIPVVVVSITDDRELGLSLGAVDWLVKPIQRDHLLDALEQAIPPRPLPRPTRVLVVDDHRETVDLLAETLTRRGFEPLRAYSGTDALLLAARDRPDAIVLDLLMPGISGFEVVRRLRESPETGEIPVLLFSFKELTPEERESLPGNVRTVVSKSRASDLLLALQRLSQQANGRRARPRPATEAG